MALAFGTAVKTFLTNAADQTSALRVIDACCGLSGNASTTNSTERLNIAAEFIRAQIVGNVQSWERMAAQQTVVVPAAPPIN